MNEDIYKQIFSKNLRYYMNLRGKNQIDIINDLGINKSAISTWVNGSRLPRMDKVDLLAKYLGCTRSDLIEEHTVSDEQSTYYINPETAEMAQAIFENKELRILFDAAKDAAPEDLQALQSMLIALKRKERGGDDG